MDGLTGGVAAWSHNELIGQLEPKTNPNIRDMMKGQQLLRFPEGMVSFGFYDAGPGYTPASWTKWHQFYAYSGDNDRPDWMGKLADRYDDIRSAPFANFVLPGAHDSGMNTNRYFGNIDSETLKGMLAIAKAVGDIAASSIVRLITNLAITQKDSFRSMLDMGTRFFDFRPGYAPWTVRQAPVFRDNIFHQHSGIPGARFDEFLHDVTAWLSDHPGEIVVLNLNFDGFGNDSLSNTMKPSMDTINEAVWSACQRHDIGIGSIRDAAKTYQQLIDDNVRLLMFNGSGFGSNHHASKNDSYFEHGDNEKRFGRKVVMETLRRMEPDSKGDYTLLQLQGTASGALSVPDYIQLAGRSSDASSPLMMTKANVDAATYPWVRENAIKFRTDRPLVILNDFVDPVMAHIAEDVTLQRMRKTK